MARRRRSTSIPDREFFGELVTYLHSQRDAERCPTPVTTGEIEQLLQGSLAPRESRRVRGHLADCVFCLNAYAELRGAHETRVSLPLEALDLHERVREWHRMASDAIRRFRHRAVQKAYSERSTSSAARVSVAEARPRSRALRQLDLRERALREQLDTLRALRPLLLSGQALWQEIDRSRLPQKARQELLLQLERDCELLAQGIEEAVEQVAP